VVSRSDQIDEPLIVAIRSLPVNTNNSLKLSECSNKRKFEKLISLKNRELASTSEILEFPSGITNNFYVANLDKNRRFDLVASALSDYGIHIFPDDYHGFINQPEAQNNIENSFSEFLEVIKSGRVKTLDLREIYVPTEYYADLVKNINVKELEFDESTFRLGNNGIRFSNGFSEISCENIIFDKYFLEAFSGNPEIRRISILNGKFSGAISSPIIRNSSSMEWLDEFRCNKTSNFDNLSKIVLNDSDPRILTALTWLHLPNLQYLDILHNNRIFHCGIESEFIQASTCAVQHGTRWPNLRQVSISYIENYIDRYKNRINIDYQIDQHLNNIIGEFWKKNKISYFREIELIVD
jgi:hypothetical protein